MKCNNNYDCDSCEFDCYGQDEAKQTRAPKMKIVNPDRRGRNDRYKNKRIKKVM